MNDVDKELYISRITSGSIRFKLHGKVLYLSSARPRDRLGAEEIYADCFREASLRDIFTETEMLSEMKSIGLWSKGDDERVEELPTEIEDLKVGLFKSEGNAKAQKGIRMALKKAKTEFTSLLTRKSEFLHHTCSGMASVFKAQYLLYAAVIDRDDNFMFDADNFWQEDFKLVDQIYSTYVSSFSSEPFVREVSRTDPWRSLWTASKSEGSLLGVPAAHINKDQMTLINWSRFYDSIQESPDCPSTDVVEDDDMLDGWVISQSRARETAKFQRELEEKSSKHAGAGEVGIMVDNKDYADKLYDHNNPQAKARVRSMQKAVARGEEFRQGKTVRDQDLPLVNRDIQMQAVRESKGS